MKPRTYFGVALLFPFILWGMCALAVLVLSSRAIPNTWETVLMPVFYYAFGIILWFIPYCLLAVGMWIWSKNRAVKALQSLALIAPLIMAVLIVIEAMLVSLLNSNLAQAAAAWPVQAAVIGGLTLVFGYLCVGVAFALFKLLQVRHLIAEETPPPA